MKITSKQLAYNINNNSELAKVNLIHGDDLGLIKDLSKKLSNTLSKGDELAIEHISALKIVEDQSVLFDSLFAVSMFASLKIIIIDDFIDLGQKQRKLNDIIAGILDEIDRFEDTYLIIPALSLDASSAVVKKFEKDSLASSVRCFVDNNMDLKKVILDFFANKNKQIDTKALIYLQASLGNDRMITLQELEKLDVYTLNNTDILLQDCLDCIVSADSVNLFKFCDAVGLKDKNLAQKSLFLLEEEGHDINMISSGLARHLKRLLIVKKLIALQVLI